VSNSNQQVNSNIMVESDKTTNTLNLGGQIIDSKTNNLYSSWFLVSFVTITIFVGMGIYLHKKHF